MTRTPHPLESRPRNDRGTRRGLATPIRTLLLAAIVLGLILSSAAADGTTAPFRSGWTGAPHGGLASRGPGRVELTRPGLELGPGSAPSTSPTPTGGLPDGILGSANLLNGTFQPGYVGSPQGLGPQSAAYDPAKGEVFVADLGSSRVSVFDAGLQQLLATIPVGAAPVSVAYDPAGGEVYVANYDGNDVSIINDTNLSVVATIPVGAQSGYTASAPEYVTYDPTDKALFVPQVGHYISPCCTYNVTEFDGLTNGIVRTIHAGAGPVSAEYDPTSNLLYVADYDGASISTVIAATGAVVGTYDLHAIPIGMALDAVDGILAVITVNGYVTNLTEFSLPGDTISPIHWVDLPSGAANSLGSMTYDGAAGLFLTTESQVGLIGVNPFDASLTTFAVSASCLTGLNYDPAGRCCSRPTNARTES